MDFTFHANKFQLGGISVKRGNGAEMLTILERPVRQPQDCLKVSSRHGPTMAKEEVARESACVCTRYSGVSALFPKTWRDLADVDGDTRATSCRHLFPRSVN